MNTSYLSQWVSQVVTNAEAVHGVPGTFGAVHPRRERYPMASRTLDNGLRVVVSPTPGLGVVAVNLWYDVGSRHEEPHRQGFAHLFEHLMFQGSRHVAAGDHFALLQGDGGSLNATTSFDRTNYFESMPSGVLDLALWLEADRMAYLDDVLTRGELHQPGRRRRAGAQPADGQRALRHRLRDEALPLIFDADHPYGHLPIGDMEHLAAATLGDVSAFHAALLHAEQRRVVDRRRRHGRGRLRQGRDLLRSHPARRRAEAGPPAGAAARHRSARLDFHEDVPAPAVWFAARLPVTRRTRATSPRSTWPAASSARARPVGCTAAWSARIRSALSAGIGHQPADRR